MWNKFLTFLGLIQCIAFAGAMMNGDFQTAAITGTAAIILVVAID